jgi:sulfur carrier protein ThiS adenylyltransferase
MRIGIAGAGGIGSNVARYLAQARYQKVRIVDFDRLEPSNLNRQFYRTDQIGQPKVTCLKENLIQIFPDMDIEAVNRRLAPGDFTAVFKDCHVVVEGLDDPGSKKHLVEELSAARIPVVCASGIAGRNMDQIRTRTLGFCHVVGDFSTDADQAEIFPPKVGMIAAMMAKIVLMLAARRPKAGQQTKQPYKNDLTLFFKEGS